MSTKIKIKNRLLSVPFFLTFVMLVALQIGSLNSVWAEPGWDVVFSNGFEESNLTPSDGSLWTTLRTKHSVFPGTQPSTVTRVTDKAHSGNYSLRCFADEGDASNTTKADIYKTNFDLRLGETYRISAWFWIPANTYIKTITLIDVECTSSGKANGCDINKDTGPRIWIYNRKNSNPPHIRLGRGKLSLPSVEGSLPIPVGEWFKLTVEMALGSGSSGHTKIWINDVLEVDDVGTNIQPDHMLGLDHYNFLQFGLTVNATGDPPGQYSAVTVYVDDVLIEHQTDDPQEEDPPPDPPTGFQFTNN